MKIFLQMVGLSLVPSVFFLLGSEPALSMDAPFPQHGTKRTNKEVQIDDPDNTASKNKKPRTEKLQENKILQQNLRINHPNILSIISQDTYKEECRKEKYNISLNYYCNHLDKYYVDIGFVGMTAFNGRGYLQEFLIERWDSNRELSFEKYRTKGADFLAITKDMLPVQISVWLIAVRQPQEILQHRYHEELPKPSLEAWRKWKEVKKIFEIKESDVFDSNGKIEVSKILINCPAPESIGDIDYVK